MKLDVYTVYDKAIEAFLAPFYSRTRAEAMRSVAHALSNPEHTFALKPSDYRLYHLGVYDDSRGMFVLEEAPVFVCSLEELTRQLELPLPLSDPMEPPTVASEEFKAAYRRAK